MQWQSFESADSIFRLKYPRMWELVVVEDVPSFFDPIDGSGAFQAIAMTPAAVTDEATGRMMTLKEVLKAHMERVGVKEFTQAQGQYANENGREMLAHEFMFQERYWFTALLREKDATILCFYNADAVPASETGLIISEIVKSVTFLV